MVPSFSQRRGLKPTEKQIQLDSIDDDLKNSLWNCLLKVYWNKFETEERGSWARTGVQKSFSLKLWEEHYKRRIDQMPSSWGGIVRTIENEFLAGSYNVVYDLIEFIFENFEIPNSKDELSKCCNKVLEKEFAGYRLVGGKITEIISTEEISEVEEALQLPIDSIKQHFKTALEHLSDKTSPDFRNSIKESISAVEAVCKLITKNNDTTMGAALQEIEDKGTIELHTDMKEAFQKLYNYTSDASGIRHALMDSKIDSDFDDAKFMLVSCSSIVNYLISKANKAGINLN